MAAQSFWKESSPTLGKTSRLGFRIMFIFNVTNYRNPVVHLVVGIVTKNQDPTQELFFPFPPRQDRLQKLLTAVGCSSFAFCCCIVEFTFSTDLYVLSSSFFFLLVWHLGHWVNVCRKLRSWPQSSQNFGRVPSSFRSMTSSHEGQWWSSAWLGVAPESSTPAINTYLEVTWNYRQWWKELSNNLFKDICPQLVFKYKNLQRKGIQSKEEAP